MNFRKLSTLKAFIAKQNKKQNNDVFDAPDNWVPEEPYDNSAKFKPKTGLLTTPEGIQWQFDTIPTKNPEIRHVFFMVINKGEPVVGDAKIREVDFCVNSILLTSGGLPYKAPKNEKPVYWLSPIIYSPAKIEGDTGEFWQERRGLFARYTSGSKRIGSIYGPVYYEVATKEESDTEITFCRPEDFSKFQKYFVVHDRNDRCENFTVKPDEE